MSARRIRVIGIGPGDPDQVTIEAVRAINDVAFFVVPEKGTADPLVAAREALLARHLEHEAVLVRVTDPERDRSATSTATTAGYEGVVTDWHDARATAYEEAILSREGDVGFLVWGDPAFYDSTIRIVDKVLERGRVAAVVDVVPGISSLQLLAARHGIVLHEIGQPIHVTTGRRLHEAVEQGQDNLVVMLNARLDLDGLEDWHVWWGANLGTTHEALVAGRVGDVLPTILAARDDAKLTAGWVMDAYVLRRPRAR